MEARFVGRVEKIAGEDDLIEEIPLASIVECAHSLLIKHVVPRIVEIVRSAGVLVALGSEGFGRSDRKITGIVVEVAHNDNACFGVLLEESLFQSTHLITGTLTHRALRAARRPVVDDEIELLITEIAFDRKEAARDVGGVATQETILIGIAFDATVLVDVETEIHVGLAFGGVDVGNELGFDKAEGFGIVEQRHIDATTVGTIEVHITITASGQGGFAEQIFERTAVFDLTQTDNCSTGRIFLVAELGAEFAQNLGDVAEFGRVLLFCPLIRTGGKELVVVLAGIVLRIEEIFDVIEPHSIKHFLLCRGGKNSDRKDEEQDGK